MAVFGFGRHNWDALALARKGLAQGFAPNFAIPEKFVADFKQLTYPGFRSAHNESVANRSAKPTYDRLAGMKPIPPLLAIVGSLDAIVPPEEVKYFERLAGARVVTTNGAGHSPWLRHRQRP